MRRAAIPLAFGLAMSVTPAALAQENAEADGTRLERFLEEQLSAGDGFDVDLTGFRGALSSAAQLERLTISDAEGEWLILEEAQLEWTRSALLRGVLDVQALTAERLQVLRTPLPASGPDLRPAEATPFALPELPVEIQIAEVAIAELSLGEPILGQAAQFSFQGSASLAEGDGHANLELIRQDGPQGVFDLDTRYTNTTRELSLSLSLEEAAGGLISDLLNLPDRPALSLSANGSGPITDFTADIALASNGTPRFGGQVTSRSQTETGDHVIAVDLGGDISPLVIADYRDFFGDDVTLQSQVTLFEDGRIALEGLSLRSAALSLSGDVALRADGHPQAFHLTGRLADPNAPSVRLPIPNQDLRIGAADLDIFFDAAEGERVSGQFLVQGLDADTLSIAQISAEIAGAITEQDGAVSAVVASLSADTQGLRHRDPALSQALGEDHSLRSDLSWIEGAPVFLTNLDLRAGDVALTGAASVAASGMAVQIALGVDAIAEDLTRFAAVAGQTLAGSVTGSLEGQIEALSGAFDLTLTGTGRDLEIVEGLPSELLAGDTTLTLQARRDETGISLEALNLDAAELDLEAQGRLSADLGALVANVELANLGRFVPVVPGPVSARLSLERQGSDPWQTQAQIDGPAGVTVALQGLVGLPNGHVDLTANGQLPLALANRAIAPRSVSGNLGFDLALSGAPEIAGLSGQFSASGVRVALPTIQTALESVSLSGGLSNGAVSTVLSGRIGTGGQVQADARVSLLDPGLPAQITIQGRDLRLVDPTLYETRITSADLTYAGNLTGSAQVSGTITLGETELRVPETGLGTAQIPQITHIGESFAERQTRIAAGLVQTGSGSAVGNLGLDLTITAPGRVFLRGRGLDAELGGTLRLGGTSANVIPAGRFDLIRGRLSILGTRLDLSEGSATLQGNFDPFIRLLASSRTPGYRIDVGLIGLISAPEISFSSDPALPEDEVLAQLLFGRSVSALSPVQLLQLADAAAGLAGGSSQSGIFASLREGTGLDDLDFQTDETGNAAVRAGRYLSNNVYTDLTLGASGETDLSLNIDLTDNITARGSFSSDGDSSVGVFFERDY